MGRWLSRRWAGASCRGAIEPEQESPLGHDFNSMGWKAFGAKLENWEDCLNGLQGLGMECAGSPHRGRQRARHRRQCIDRKSTRLNSSHVSISYAVFCLKK